ncbi:MAG: hypothetical protein OXL97_03495 [Chloroflexota bacterium]|nr:hypothetical protein [Chloroflexota bacterium]MDE2886544.1 hypothetical protein [Chloroflexota bacterium]
MSDGNLKIGFLKPGAGSIHYDEFAAMVPEGIDLEMVELGVLRSALTDFAARADAVIERATTMTREHGWQGVIVPGAPVEVQNPGLRARLSEALDVPFTTALGAGENALRAFGASRILLLTPFDSYMNSLIVPHLTAAGFDVQLADLGFNSEQEAVHLDGGVVFDMVRGAVQASDGVQALYFQGAVLNPLPVIDDMEAEFGLPVVASNPAMLWSVASQLGGSFSIEGKGRLVREWPPLP